MILHCSVQGYTTGVSVSGLCSKDVSYRPVKMSRQPPERSRRNVPYTLHCTFSVAVQLTSVCKVYGRIAPLAQCYNSAKVGGCSCPGRRMLDPKAGFTILLPPIKSHRHHYSLTHYSDRIRSFTTRPKWAR